MQHATTGVLRIAAKMRACLTHAVYNKALRLPASSEGRDATTGEIVNLVSTDSQRLLDGAIFTNIVVASPLLVAAGVYFLVAMLGAASTFIGLATYLVLLPLHSFMSREMMRNRRKQMGSMDKRIKVGVSALGTWRHRLHTVNPWLVACR